MSDYKQPTNVAVPKCNGYPNNISNTATKKIRGTNLATKGTMYSGKSN